MTDYWNTFEDWDIELAVISSEKVLDFKWEKWAVHLMSINLGGLPMQSEQSYYDGVWIRIFSWKLGGLLM